MKKLFFIMMSLIACSDLSVSTSAMTINTELFKDIDGCVLVYDLGQQKLLAEYNPQRCQQRLPACSSFKFPLAVMAFDSGILQDENTLLKWDGKKRSIETWNQDHTAASWMRNSVVWYSQLITPQMGRERLQKYLDSFEYGNRDISAGMTSAWLTITKNDADPSKGSLKISAYEQLEFQKKFWAHKLAVSERAYEKTKLITKLEDSPGGYELHGKTGSGYPQDLIGDFGWFVGHVQGKGRELLVVTTITRSQRAADVSFPGLFAKELTKNILKDNHLW